MTDIDPTADRLLDAQVAWVLQELRGPRMAVVVEREVDALLARGEDVLLGDLVPATTVATIADVLLRTVPGSVAVAAAGQGVAEIAHAGGLASLRPSTAVERDDVGALIDALVPLRPLLSELMERLTDSPAVGTLASRFLARVAIDVLEVNRTMTRRIPGVGSIVSMGTTAATRVVGAADKQVQALLGDSGGRGTAAVVRRLNALVLQTLDDPLLRDAALEVWDAHADEPMRDLTGRVEVDDLRRLAVVLQRIVASGASTRNARDLVAAVDQRMLDGYRARPVSVLIDDFGLRREDVLTLALAVVPPLVESAAADGWLERYVRDRLAPFYRSAAVTAILTDG